VAGLWCVGDAVKVYGNGGTQACAETAKLVSDADPIGARRNRPAGPGAAGSFVITVRQYREPARRSARLSRRPAAPRVSQHPGCLRQCDRSRARRQPCGPGARDRRAARLQRGRQIDAAQGDVGPLYTEEGVLESGSIRFRGSEMQHMRPDEVVRRGIVQVPGRPSRLRLADSRRKPPDGRFRQIRGLIPAASSIKSSSYSLAWQSDAARWPATCRAGSSRCSPSDAR
jgi:hypothetical protein